MVSNSVWNMVLMKCQILLIKEKVFRQSCVLYPYLYNVFVDDAINYIGVEMCLHKWLEIFDGWFVICRWSDCWIIYI